jgi:ABC-2 type transport system ATP-binding protein
MIVFSGVWMVYEGGVEALRGVDAVFEPGMVHVLLGPNGSGKTTMLRLMLGVLRPSRGVVRVYGIVPWLEPVRVRRLIGYVPEDDIIYHSLTVREYLDLVARVKGVPAGRVRGEVDRVMRAFMLTGKANKYIGGLSHGFKRRVLLAEAFLGDPKILLLDEPFIGVDPRIARALKTVIREMARKNRIVIMTTNVLEIAQAIADNIILLYNGRILARGSLKEILEKTSEKELEEAFLDLTMSKSEVKEIIRALTG